MKIELIDRYHASEPCSVFTLQTLVGFPPSDVIYGGTALGNVFYIVLPSSSVSKPYICEISSNLSSNQRHRGAIESILCTFNSKLKHSTCSLGLVFTGGRDHSIRVWNPANNARPYIQSLVGHGGIITAIVDGHDGTIISCSTDGMLKVWLIRSGRDEFMDPLLECKYSVSVSKGHWLTSIAITTVKTWACYVSDSSGSITVFRKMSSGGEVEKHLMQYSQQLVKQTVFERVHDLSITYMSLIDDDDTIVTLSSDGYCKLTDSKSGQIIASLRNNRMCRYVGVCYISTENRLFLNDELGYLEIFSTTKLSITSSIQLLSQTVGERSGTMTSHKFPILGSLIKGRVDNHFYIQLPFANGLQNKSGAYTGDIALWKIEVDHTIHHFQGHSGNVLAIGAYSINLSGQTSQSIGKTKYNQAAQFTEAECSLFSIGSDHVIRSWDQFDCKERFQIRTKRRDCEITSGMMIWDLSMPTLATSHDNGSVCLWNADSGNMVQTSVLRESVLCMVDGIHNNSRVLIAADLAGKIAVINLSLFDMNPTILPVDFVMNGNHDADDPGIISVAYHWKTGLMFTGGTDRTIRYRSISPQSPSTISGHNDAVCYLGTSGDYLLSGDESGDMILWIISKDGKGKILVRQICEWPANELHPVRSIAQIVQSDEEIYVVQAGLIGKIIIWKVDVRGSLTDFGQSPVRNINQWDFNDSEDQKDPVSDDEEIVFDGKGHLVQSSTFENRSMTTESQRRRDSPSKSRLSQLHINQDHDCIVKHHDDLRIKVERYAEVSQDFIESSVVQLTMQQSSVGETMKDGLPIKICIPKYLYVGTSEGSVFRYEVSAYRVCS